MKQLEFFNGSGNAVNSTIGLIIVAFAIVYPAFTLWFLRKNKGELETLKYKEKFSSLYSSIDIDKKAAILLTTLFLFRRFTLAVTLVFIVHGQALQVLITELVSLSLVGYIICY
jgi:hypothetical protein